METTQSHRMYLKPEDRIVLEDGKEITTIEFPFTISPENEVDDAIFISHLTNNESRYSLPSHELSIDRVRLLHGFLSTFLSINGHV